MDIGRAFKFVFDDERWVSKVGIGGLVTLVPILNFATYGYMLKTAQNVAQGEARPLPEWNDLGDHFMRGLYAIVINLVYFIPYIVIVALFSCVVGGLSGGAGDNDAARATAGLLGCLLVPIYLLVAFACLLFAFAGFARYVATNSLSESLKFGEVFAMVRNQPGPWLMLLLVALLASLAASLGLIACGIGVIFTSFIAYCVIGHALGQTVAEQRMLGSAAPPSSYEPPAMYQ